MFDNHVTYAGPVYDYLPHGIGEMRYPDGYKYIG